MIRRIKKKFWEARWWWCNRDAWRCMVSKLKPGGPGTSGTGLPERASIEPASTTRENNSEQRSCSLSFSLSLFLTLCRHTEIWNPYCRTVSSETETLDLFSQTNFGNRYDFSWHYIIKDTYLCCNKEYKFLISFFVMEYLIQYKINIIDLWKYLYDRYA